jgi:hypothetical protein
VKSPSSPGRPRPPTTYEFGTDTFVVRDGKILVQTFAGKITPKN